MKTANLFMNVKEGNYLADIASLSLYIIFTNTLSSFDVTGCGGPLGSTGVAIAS